MNARFSSLNYVKTKSNCGIKGRTGFHSPLKTSSPKFRSLATPIILIHWQFYYGKILPRGKIEREIWDSTPTYTRHLCLAKSCFRLAEGNVTGTRWPIYSLRPQVRTFRHIGHQNSRTVKFVLVLARYRIFDKVPSPKIRKKRAPPPSPLSHVDLHENTHSVYGVECFLFPAIFRRFLAVKHWRLFSQDSVSVEILLPPGVRDAAFVRVSTTGVSASNGVCWRW